MSRKDRQKKQRKKELAAQGVVVARPRPQPRREDDGLIVFRSVDEAKAAVANAGRPDRGIIRSFPRYDVTIEALDHPALRGLTPVQRVRYENLAKKVVGYAPAGDLRELLREIQEMIEELPDVPHLYGHLSTTLWAIGRKAESLAMSKRTFERFPDYLFGQLQYAIGCLQAGLLDDVPESFRAAEDVAALDPSRRTFHVVEVAMFEFGKGTFSLLKGDIADARRRLALIEDVHPRYQPLGVMREMIDRAANSGW